MVFWQNSSENQKQLNRWPSSELPRLSWCLFFLSAREQMHCLVPWHGDLQYMPRRIFLIPSPFPSFSVAERNYLSHRSTSSVLWKTTKNEHRQWDLYPLLGWKDCLLLAHSARIVLWETLLPLLKPGNKAISKTWLPSREVLLPFHYLFSCKMAYFFHFSLKIILLCWSANWEETFSVSTRFLYLAYWMFWYSGYNNSLKF